MRRTEALKAITRVLRQPVADVPAADLIYGRALAHIEDPTGDTPAPWAMQVDVLALKIAAALPLTDNEQQSPLAQAEDAKRARDLLGEVCALTDGYAQLTNAPWYPARPGDLIHLHYEAGGQSDARGETYRIEAGAHGFLSMRSLCHTLPDEDAGMAGCFAVDDDPDPLAELWMEAGPHRLTIVRDGLVVHHGASRNLSPAVVGGMLESTRELGNAVHEAKRYLERGEPELALARLRSPRPLPPCGTPGPMPDHADCARPRGHRPPCSPDADYVSPPHECPALPEQLYAVLAVGPKRTTVSFEGLYQDKDAALEAASGWDQHTEAERRGGLRVPDYVFVDLPAPGGASLAVVAPMPLLPDPRAEDEWAAEGAATALDHIDPVDDTDDDFPDDDGDEDQTADLDPVDDEDDDFPDGDEDQAVDLDPVDDEDDET